MQGYHNKRLSLEPSTSQQPRVSTDDWGGRRFTVFARETKPSDLLIPSILVTLLCFWPTGVIAVWKSVESRQAMKNGEFKKAHISADVAKSVVLFSVGLGLVQIVVMVTVVMLQLHVFQKYATTDYAMNTSH
ncbi:proline-rich transmembrane protein 1 [Nematostella vectensis]|uniref:proline-rich transmembrane protein 1 n=1 Tax=Nematostella vectensis TaxID=45351 RepID=UPI00138FA45E|nr:proline-rich transmembrane protein 1 [Nematostella vectensis]